jgi:hypothetical protein
VNPANVVCCQRIHLCYKELKTEVEKSVLSIAIEVFEIAVGEETVQKYLEAE